jgi:branched-chain amino acid transport system permease protein
MLAKARVKWSYLAITALLLFLILIPFDWSLGQYKTLMISIGIHSMVTVGLCLLLGYTGQVSLGHAAFFGTGAYFSAILSKTYGVDPWLAMLIAALTTGCFAYVVAYPIFRLRGNYLAVATLGLGVIIYILFRQLSQYTGGPDGMAGIPYLSIPSWLPAIGGFTFDTPFKRYFLVWFFCLTILLVSQFIVNSRIGRSLRAIHGSEAAAESIGINVDQFKVKIFVWSTVCASLAGSLFAHHVTHVSPSSFDPLASVIVVVMAVIGGLASIWGAIFGAGTVMILKNELLLRFGEWDIVVYGLVLMLVMIFMPQGLFVKLREMYVRLKEMRERRLGDRARGAEA